MTDYPEVQIITREELIKQLIAALDELGVTAKQIVEWVEPCGCCFDCPPSMEARIHHLWFVAEKHIRELAAQS